MNRQRLFTVLTVLVLVAGPAAALELAEAFSVSGDPSGIYHAGDGSGRLFIAQQQGYIEIWDGDEILSPRFLDIQGRVDFGGEQGLLGVAFPPDFATSQEFYVHYSDTPGGDTTISRFQVTGNPNVADPDSEEIILTVDQPFSNHNGGQILFGPDGYLYIALGDGGSANDPGNRSQDLSLLLGKMLRIDPAGGIPYAIPADNPFVGVGGALDEIWAYGLRNPWRFSFDRDTGDMFIGDVGQDSWEEVDFQPASSPGGENYGWRLMEGNDCFNPPMDCNDGSLTLPILVYEHTGFLGDCSMTGGYRYRGDTFPLFEGTYFYGDYCTGKIWAGEEQMNGSWTSAVLIESGVAITTFGEDEDGELYVADQNGTIYQLVDDRPFCNVRADREVYTEGDTITLAPASVVNLGETNLTVHVQVGLLTPSQQIVRLVDRGGDGSFVLKANTVLDFAPQELRAVDADTPTGTYEVVCRMLDPFSGQVLLELRDDFTVE